MQPGSDGQSLDAALAALTGHAIVAGFGIPGREVANLFASLNFPYCVVEMNPATVHRCADGGLLILQGDATDEQTLLKAGVQRAAVLALAMPNEQAVLKGIPLARRLNPNIRILARCRHVSTAMEATKLGADDVLSEEQVVAQEYRRKMAAMLPEGAGVAGRE